MKRLVLATILALVTLPAVAGSIAIDLPRLSFPAPTEGGQTTRADQSPLAEAGR